MNLLILIANSLPMHIRNNTYRHTYIYEIKNLLIKFYFCCFKVLRLIQYTI